MCLQLSTRGVGSDLGPGWGSWLLSEKGNVYNLEAARTGSGGHTDSCMGLASLR